MSGQTNLTKMIDYITKIIKDVALVLPTRFH